MEVIHVDKYKAQRFVLFNFETTSYCNAKCPSCFRTTERYFSFDNSFKLNHLSTEDFDVFLWKNGKYLRDIRLSNNIVAKFCGELGDPLMHPEIDELVLLASNFFDRVEIYTNGGLRTPKWIKSFLQKNKKLFLIFSIDGLTHKTNSLYRIDVNTNLAFNNMFESAKHRVTKWDFTVFDHNFQEVDQAIVLAREKDIKLHVRINEREYSKITEKNLIKLKNTLNDLPSWSTENVWIRF